MGVPEDPSPAGRLDFLAAGRRFSKTNTPKTALMAKRTMEETIRTASRPAEGPPPAAGPSGKD